MDICKNDSRSPTTGIGEVWYDPGQPTNLLSYGHMQERFKVTYQERADTFDLKMKEGTLKFEKQDYLYVHQPSDKYIANIAATKGNTKNTKPKITEMRSSLIPDALSLHCSKTLTSFLTFIQ